MAKPRISLAVERLRRQGKIVSIPVAALPSPQGPPPGSVDSLELVGPVPLPVEIEGRHMTVRWYVAGDRKGDDPNATVNVVVFGDLSDTGLLPLVRVHSACAMGDLFGSRGSDCGPQLRSALAQVAASAAGGMLLYLPSQEGRSIGLWAEAAAYLLQEDGFDTYEANWALGFNDDDRDYRWAASVLLHFFGTRRFRLLTNNPDKVTQLRDFGLTGLIQHGHVTGVGERNHRYLAAKREHGHSIPSAALGLPPRESEPGGETG